MKAEPLGLAWKATLCLLALLIPQVAAGEHVYWMDLGRDDARPRAADFAPHANLRVFEDFALLVSLDPVEPARRPGFEAVSLPDGAVPVLARLRSDGRPRDVALADGLDAPVLRAARDFALAPPINQCVRPRKTEPPPVSSRGRSLPREPLSAWPRRSSSSPARAGQRTRSSNVD